MTPETNLPVFASLKSAMRAKLKSQTAPSSPFRGEDKHTGIGGRVNSFLKNYADLLKKAVFRGELPRRAVFFRTEFAEF
jgi:hypothetical protein